MCCNLPRGAGTQPQLSAARNGNKEDLKIFAAFSAPIIAVRFLAARSSRAAMRPLQLRRYPLFNIREKVAKNNRWGEVDVQGL